MLTFDKTRFSFSRISRLSLAVARSGKTFRLEAAEWPVVWPCPPEIEISSIGFWYTMNDASRECVVVIFRPPAKQPFEILRQVETIADKLAERLARNCRLASAYEFDCSKMALKAC